jgi:N,N'-diacetyllegionaminate synthase
MFKQKPANLLKQVRFLKVMLVSKVFIIAEAGVNHNGSIDLAKKLIDAAADAGADAVKFQTFKADRLATKLAHKADYQKSNTSVNESQYEMLKKLELDEDMHKAIIEHCKQQQIMFLSSAFDNESVDMLNNFGMSIFKIPSGEITNLPYLRHVGGLKKPIILSSGMSDLVDIKNALDVLIECGVSKNQLTVLHATTEYPCPIQEVNISAMQTIRANFGVKVGYSDHTNGIEVSVAAVALGACVIEKHFTLDQTMEGPDHKASLEPNEFKSMVLAIRNIEKALGDGIKKPSKSEIKNMAITRKSIVALRAIKSGEIFSVGNLAVKRPGTGISPMDLNKILGKIARRDFLPDEQIEL